MTRVLFFELDSSFGGIESFLLNMVNNMDLSKNNIVFDIITSVSNPAAEDVFLKSGANIIHTIEKKKIFKYRKCVETIIKNGNYSMIHIQKNSLVNNIPIEIAEKFKIPYIVHAQNSAPSYNNFITTLIHKINVWRNRRKNYIKLACGTNAALWMFGSSDDVIYVKNGINTEQFALDIELRKSFRENNHLENTLVICNVGRFTPQKNHIFILQVFEQVTMIEPDSRLLLVGDGTEMERVKRLAKEKNLVDKIIFYGSLPREKERIVLMGSDVFLLPSLYEGVSIASVEAQMAGLSLIVSDTVDKDTNIVGDVVFKSLQDSPEEWAATIVNHMSRNNKNYEQSEVMKSIQRAGYDMKNTTRELIEMYSGYKKSL